MLGLRVQQEREVHMQVVQRKLEGQERRVGQRMLVAEEQQAEQEPRGSFGSRPIRN